MNYQNWATCLATTVTLYPGSFGRPSGTPKIDGKTERRSEEKIHEKGQEISEVVETMTANFKCDMCGTVQPLTSTVVLSRYSGSGGYVTTSNSGNNGPTSNFSCVSCGNAREGVHSF